MSSRSTWLVVFSAAARAAARSSSGATSARPSSDSRTSKTRRPSVVAGLKLADNCPGTVGSWDPLDVHWSQLTSMGC